MDKTLRSFRSWFDHDDGKKNSDVKRMNFFVPVFKVINYMEEFWY